MISLVIPVYNFEKGLPETIARLRAWVKNRSDVLEIIFVNDGSTDKTSSILNIVEKPMRVVTLGKNSGKGAAVQAGMLAAEGEYIFFTDADLPYELKAVDEALEKFTSGAEAVVGSRHLPGSAFIAKRSKKRQLSSIIFSWLANILLLSPIEDTQCGFKGFTRDAARKLFTQMRESRYVFDVEVLHHAQHVGMRIALVPVTLVTEATSSIQLVRDGFYMAISLLRLYVRTRTHVTRRDVVFIGGLGCVMALLWLPTLQNVGLLTILATHGLPIFFTVILLVLLMPCCMLGGALGLTLLPLHKHSAAQFSRYAVVGAFNTSLNAAIFNSFIYLTGISQGPFVIIFALLTFAIIITQSFFWNIFWTFHNMPPQNRKKQYMRFFAVTAVTGLVNLSIIHVIVNVIGAPHGISPALWANIALVITISTSILGNFFGYKFFVFAK